jgi:ABC-2 type transport system permease protein
MAAIVRKEMLHIIRDPRNLFLVTVSPAFLLLLLSNVFTYEVKHIKLAVLDQDRSSVSRQYVASLNSDQDLVVTRMVERYEDILPLLTAGDFEVGLVIPPGFADTIRRGQPAQVQAIIDGTNPFSSHRGMGSLTARSAVFVAGASTSSPRQGAALVEVRSQAWYNAGLRPLFTMVPGLLAIVLTMPAMAFALALTREKESGTLEGLVATPISGFEYLAGKLLAYMLAALVSALLAVAVAVLWFKVPFRGSLAVYLLLAGAYFLACMGAAVVIANFVRSQQTAMFIVLLVFLVPSFFLAGLMSPVSTKSLSGMLTSYALPSTHFIEISRNVFLKGLDLAYLGRPALILLGMGLGALLVGLALFQKKVS